MAYKPFNIFDTVESPEQAQQRILRQRQEAQKGFTTNQTIGYNLADLIGKAFGGGIGTRDKAQAEWRATTQNESREKGQKLAEQWQQVKQIEDPQQRQEAEKALLGQLEGTFVNSSMLQGTSPENARMFALANTAHVLSQSDNPEDQRLASLARNSLTEYNAELRQRRLEEERLMVSTDASRSQLKESDLRFLNSQTPEQLQVLMDAEKDPARQKQIQAAMERAEEAKRARLAEERRKEEGIRLQQENLQLSQKREERIASQLGADERRIVKEADDAYNAAADDLTEVLETNSKVTQTRRVGGKIRAGLETINRWAGTETDDVSVLQTELQGRALEKAFSYKADAQMSEVEFTAYMKAAVNATASPRAWSEFLRMEAKFAARQARQAAFTSDYMSGQDMGKDSVWGLENPPAYNDGIPRGIEGAGTSWRKVRENIYAGIDEMYSVENWKLPPEEAEWQAAEENKYAPTPEAAKDDKRRREIENDLRNRYRTK